MYTLSSILSEKFAAETQHESVFWEELTTIKAFDYYLH